jgi:hypothetical protein
MLSNNIANSFNIFSLNINNPNLVNDKEVAVATYIKNTKQVFNYGYDIGFENKFFVESVIAMIGDKDGIKIDKAIKDTWLQTYINQQLIDNGFYDMIVDIDSNFQDKNIKITINKNTLIDYSTI